MLPLTMLAAQKVFNLLANGNALGQQINSIASANNIEVPPITSGQVLLSSAPAAIGDMNIQLTYPRVSLYSSILKNIQTEKFRSLSGTILVIAEIWASANLVTQTDEWIHYYVEAVTEILRQNVGDWGDGFFFAGAYDVQLQPPKPGGIGYVESAKVTCNLNVSRN